MRFRRWVFVILVISALVATGCSDDTVEHLSSASTTITSTTITSTAITSTTTAAAGATTAPPSTTTARSGAAATTTIAPPPSTSPVTTSRAAALFGVPVGAETEGAVKTLVSSLGQPEADTGWNVGCALDSPTLKNERIVTWGALRVLFRRDTEAAAGTMQGYGFVIPEGIALAPTDAAARLALPNGIVLGMPISQVATKLASKTVVNSTFGWVSVTTAGAEFTADGSAGNAPLNAVAVPHVFSCD